MNIYNNTSQMFSCSASMSLESLFSTLRFDWIRFVCVRGGLDNYKVGFGSSSVTTAMNGQQLVPLLVPLSQG